MPYKRAISPFSLETCEPATNDIISDELLASDDELSEAERAAKRQRIEKLAESYLHGQPLFILSASLRGPFDKGWRNPWKKDRRAIVNRQADTRRERPIHNVGHVIQETDLRQPKYREDLAVAAPDVPAVARRIAPLPSVPVPNASSSNTSRSAQKRSLYAATHDEHNRVAPRSIKKPKDAISSRHDDASFATYESVDWLKKDRRRMNFTQFEPPSSPTPKIVSRQAENKAKVGVSRTLEVRVPATVSRKGNLKTPAVGEEAIVEEPMGISPDITRVVGPTERTHEISAEKSLPVGNTISHKGSPNANGHAASSIRVISSSSQLPRFEYRRWHPDNNSPQTETHSPITATKSAVTNLLREKLVPSLPNTEKAQQDLPFNDAGVEVQDVPAASTIESASVPRAESDTAARVDQTEVPDFHAVSAQDGGAVVGPDALEFGEPSEQPADDDATGAMESGLVYTSKDLRFSGEAGVSTCIDTENPPPTEQNTYDNLPSAQVVPVLPGVSDRMPSLHSTAMIRPNPGQSTEDSSDTQLSTQAALLHAQRSFQEDLESPEPEFIHLAEPEDTVLGPDEESLLAHETPYNVPHAAERASNTGLRRFSKDRIQAMSTQCMIDAVTPYTFSTEKKPRACRDIQPDRTSERALREPHLADLFAQSPLIPSPSQDNEYHTANSSPHKPDTHPDPACTHRSTTQGTLLPFALSGSTPMTAQDGQGAPQGAESFDLSQAIADAGSWLQQSFDFMKDTRRPSQPTRPA